MRKFYLTMIVALAAMQAVAGTVDHATAQGKAAAFLKAQAGNTKFAAAPVEFTSERVVTNSANVALPVYYIFNTRDRFIIVSGEDRGEEILAVGDGTLDLNNIPTNMQYWLDFYKKQIEYLQARPGMVVQTMSQTLKAPSRAQNVSPLLTARWDQTTPFWNQCVFNSTQCLTGCPATSLAQVFYYWKYPTAATPSLSGYTTGGYTIPALPSTTFDWVNMRDYYGWNGSSGTTAQKAAVATLMRYIGQAEHMEYGPNGSGISSSRTDLIATACKTFGYDSNVRAIYKENAWGSTIYNDTQWATLMQNELAAGHPIVYCGLSTTSGHAFNVDGYTVSTNMYHVNWGWSGSGNGDFALNAFTDMDGETFNEYQSMVIGIQPPGGQVTFPVLNIEPESLDFGTVKTGESVTRTFHVTGSNLLGDITFSRSSGSTAYSVYPESLTAAEVEAGADITVTFAPTTGGTLTANIQVQGGAAESCVVACTGVAQAVPKLTANPMELSFTTPVGETATGTFNLKGYNLEGYVYVSVVNNTGGFSVTPANVTKANAMNGYDITVSYKPTNPGNHTARVMLRSKNADTIYVALNGVATVTTYAPVMQPANANYVTSSSFRADWTDQTMASAVASYTLWYATGSDVNTVTDITNKYYTLENLTAGAMYSYKVKAIYVDGTESDWSNTEQVTLLQGHNFNPGDVNHDGLVNIDDVTGLIDYLLGSTSDVCSICADVDGNGSANIDDVTGLIDMLLNGSAH
ncbi:MAG: C10 family peptidase [Muribaculaceae bacterium]|nr:C10 family peptidase [Muribaculaceae bacterium]